MNLEDLKNTWEQEKIETTPEISIEKQKELRFSLEKNSQEYENRIWTTLIFPFIIAGIPFNLRKLH